MRQGRILTLVVSGTEDFDIANISAIHWGRYTSLVPSDLVVCELRSESNVQ